MMMRRMQSSFTRRHIGPSEKEQIEMLRVLGIDSFDTLVHKVIPKSIRAKESLLLNIPQALDETQFLQHAERVFHKNKIWRSYIGMGYHNCHVPQVIVRNVLENPGWYTQYTPYQAEISQGRLEMLYIYQTAISDLTGLDVANASLLDEASAAAESFRMAVRITKKKTFYADSNCTPAVLNALRTEADALNGVELIVTDLSDNGAAIKAESKIGGIIVSYPDVFGRTTMWQEVVDAVHAIGGVAICVADPLAITRLKSPGEFDFDIAVGSCQRLGIPMFYGGPHAAYIACKEQHVKQMPGRVIGLSRDRDGNDAYRLALQTREQFIRKDKATSNICTAQALLANMSAMYCLYHGYEGLRLISKKLHSRAAKLACAIQQTGQKLLSNQFFDTVTFKPHNLSMVRAKAESFQINLRYDDEQQLVTIALDETVTDLDIDDLCRIIGYEFATDDFELSHFNTESLKRKKKFFTHPIFSDYRSETAMMRYLKRLENKDLSLCHSMIPLGSCSMKLNAATELVPVTWPELNIHPYCPDTQSIGYKIMVDELEQFLCDITGYDAISFQPRAGAQGEYAGLRTIRKYQASRGEGDRNICFIPDSSHGTNPASAVLAGLRVVYIKTLADGSLNVDSLAEMCAKHAKHLSCIMITYPSTFGIFDENIEEICALIHQNGGQVYLDGANLNAQVGICRPGDYGSDVSHLNLHKTFCIPHGGGGPGMGPIGVKSHLTPFLPSDPLHSNNRGDSFGSISSARFGSAAILPISWGYIRMMGGRGLRRATEVALLNANYMMKQLEATYRILYRNGNGFCAHEFIIDCKPFKDSAGVTPTDIGKRLQDYGFHAPTVAWPYTHGLSIEPTESEDKRELDRYCDALKSIRQEIMRIETGEYNRADNPLVNAPHTLTDIIADEWTHAYSRQVAAFPSDHIHPQNKFWPAVARIDDVFGDRNLNTRFTDST